MYESLCRESSAPLRSEGGGDPCQSKRRGSSQRALRIAREMLQWGCRCHESSGSPVGFGSRRAAGGPVSHPLEDAVSGSGAPAAPCAGYEEPYIKNIATRSRCSSRGLGSEKEMSDTSMVKTPRHHGHRSYTVSGSMIILQRSCLHSASIQILRKRVISQLFP